MHLKCLRGSYHFNVHLQRAWNKQKGRNFSWKICFRCPEEDLIENEQWIIDGYKERLGWKNLYNICPFAGRPMLGTTHSKEVCAHLSAINKGKKMSEKAKSRMSKAKKGKKQSPEHIAKAAAARVGRKLSLKARENMSEAQKRIKHLHWVGKKHSLETRKKMSKSAELRWQKIKGVLK
jgi:hypothetical protein